MGQIPPPAALQKSERMSGVSRRNALIIGAGAFGATASMLRGGHALAETGAGAGSGEVESHGMSAFGDLKYPADFKHFDYVNPDAPKGGVFSQMAPTRQFNQNFLTFNSFNSFILKGDGVFGVEHLYATLMAPATLFSNQHDEPDALYGNAARAVRISADGLTYRFLLRPEATFHDGSRLTAHDVAFTLNLLKEKGHPIARQRMNDFTGAEAVDDATVIARFEPKRGRDVPLFVAMLPIFSRAYYGTHNFEESSLDVPLGSGPYKIGRFAVGQFVEYDRVKDWWGEKLPVWRGRNNFDILRYEYFREREVGLQAFTAKSFLFREEFTSRVWATRYDFPAMRDGRVKREVLPDETPSGAQGWFINTRRDKFKDIRLREALIYAFDFEWVNKNIMYGSYERTHSVFQNSPMMPKGKPSPEELALLEPFRGKVPEEVFGEAFVPPVSDGSGQDRALMRRASVLLQSAGFVLKGGKRFTPQGEPFTVEFQIDDPTFQPHHLAFMKNLGQLGIDVSLRLLDAVQYRARRDQFDFDIAIERLSFSSTPGDSLRPYFSSQAAELKGSNNLAGIADPVIDALIEKIIAAESRPALMAACSALDRVFRAGRYWVAQWSKGSHWIAYWDVFGRPATKPRYATGVPDTWWYDRDKAAKIEQRG
jgi:microcin C transport system substrate-binding protein